MANVEKLRERIELLRAALAYVRDRDPQVEAPGGATEAAYVGYSDEIRRYGEARARG
jgi:hypothetical protein